MTLENIKNNINFKNFRFEEKKNWSEYHITCDVYFKDIKLADYTFNILPNLYESHYVIFGCCFVKKMNNNYCVLIDGNFQDFYKLSKENIAKMKQRLLIFAQSKYNKVDKNNVLSCLINDYNAVVESEDFDDFCNTFGYDTDSIKALDIYKALEKNFSTFSKTFTQKEIFEMQEFYQDY